MAEPPNEPSRPEEEHGFVAEVEAVAHEAEAMAERARSEATYALVLVLVFVLIIFSLAAPDEAWARGVSIVISGSTLLMALWVARVRPRRFRAAAVVVAVAILGSTIGLLSGADVAEDAVRIVQAALVAAAPVAILRDLVRYPEITLRTVFGVLAVYLLLGSFFAALYGIVASLGSGPFFAQGTDGSGADRLYFSYITITTVGYGDFTPATGVGRSLAVAEALMGQLYLVTLVSLIVGNLGRARRSPRTARPGAPTAPAPD